MSVPKYAYNIMVVRYDEDGNQEELIDRDLTADQAIDMMLYVNEAVPAVEIHGVPGQERPDMVIEDEVDEEDKESSDDDEPAPRGRQASWDKDRAKEMILDGEKAGDIADKVGAPIGSIYQLKSDMKKAGELENQGKDEAPEPETEDEDEEPEPVKPEPKVSIAPDEDSAIKQKKALFRRLKQEEKQVVKEFQEGKGVAQLFTDYPSVSVQRINDLIQAYGKLDLE